jgi:predicted outer membrane repeat protein
MRNTTRIFHLVLVIICAAALVGTSGGIVYPAHAAPAASIIRVTTTGATSGACGSTWATACDLQYALSVALSGDEIWVKAGTYKPTTNSNRSATFQLKNGVSVYGGFATMTETLRSQRNWTANVAVLSGDIGAAGNNSDNSYHVVTGSGTNGTAILDGFTVTGGNANGSPEPDDLGGGMYNYYGSPTVQNVVFSANTATTFGGGMHNSHSNPTLTNVTFSGNTVTNGDGGGMVNTDTSAPTLTNVTFSNNSVTDGNGGGMLNDNCSPTLSNVTFANNSTTGGDGGALYNDLVSTPVLTNVTFYSNTAIMSSGHNGGNGGAIYNYATSNYTMTNVTFSGNRAVGYDAYNPAYGGAMYTASGSVTARNAIFWGNAPDQAYNDSSTVTINTSVVQDGCPTGSTCPGIITANPLLGAPGNYGGYVETIPLLPGSSAIDAANDAVCPATDARGVTRPQGPHCDIGAFESSRFTLAITGGNNQSTPINTAFAQPLQVSVTANNAIEPVNGGKVTFTPPASGASASLATSPATIASGSASVNATANGIRGAYVVTASIVGGNTVTFNLRNTGVFYVKPGASGNCSSWAAACELQTALGSAGAGDEIWVAAGTYTPTTGTDPNATFTLANGVGVYGGFAGTETARSQRSWTTHVTTLSGNLSGGAHPYHVVTANSTDSTTALDGFTVTGGQGTGQVGGGVYINNGSLTIANCRITNNSADYGGGVFQSGSGRIDIINSLVERNHSGNQGGGLYINGDVALINTLVLTNTSGADGGGLTDWAGHTNLAGGMFAANSAGGNGGGVNANNSVNVSGTQFISNTAGGDGGGLLQWNGVYTVTVTNARFERNRSTGQGGGVSASGSVDAANTLFAGNQAGGGGAAIRLSGGRLRHVTIAHPTQGSGPAIRMASGTANITDTIIAGYTVGISQTGGTLYADYDLFSTTTPTQTSGGTMNWGSHNLNSNPQFVNPASGDYHLAASSPAIDAGTNAGVTTDLDGIVRPQGRGYDIGAYEYRFIVYLPLVLRNAP